MVAEIIKMYVWFARQEYNVGLMYNTCAGELQIPQETLYKKNVLLMRGRFRPFTLLHNDMLQGELGPTGPIILLSTLSPPQVDNIMVQPFALCGQQPQRLPAISH